MRKLEIVSSPWWDDKPVWIIGGGPSASCFDFSRTTGARVLLVNDAVDLAPAAMQAAVFSLDNNWVRRRRDFLNAYRGEKYIALPLETWPDCGGIPGVTYLQWSHADGLSEDPGVIATGCNSGYGAINLAYLKRARTINLIGYDMDPADNDEYRYWIPIFRTMLPQLKAHGISVINHNPNSFIDAFPRVYSSEIIGVPA